MIDKLKLIKGWGIIGTLIGIIFLVIGIAGFFLPFLPGFLFFWAGLIILGLEFKFLRKYRRRIFGKF